MFRMLRRAFIFVLIAGFGLSLGFATVAKAAPAFASGSGTCHELPRDGSDEPAKSEAEPCACTWTCMKRCAPAPMFVAASFGSHERPTVRRGLERDSAVVLTFAATAPFRPPRSSLVS
jgi:hypothetical protein